MMNMASTVIAAGYFAECSQAKEAIEALKDAGFTSSQISSVMKPTDCASDTDASESVWHKLVSFFDEDTPDLNLYSKERNSPESYKVVGLPMHGGYGCQQSDSHRPTAQLDGLNPHEDRAKYFDHRFSLGKEGALVAVKAAGKRAEAESILERYHGDIGRDAAGLSDPSDVQRAKT